MTQFLPIYLQLPPEQGGVRFGPFTNHVNVGSDAKRCQLVLDGRHGIFPTHAMASQVSPGVLSVQAAGPQCQLFVVPYGQTHPWPVKAPVQVKNGDTLIFGTPQGPQFTVMVDDSALKSTQDLVKEGKSKGGEAGFMHAASAFTDKIFGAPESSGIKGEVHRRAQSELLRKSPFREIYGLWMRIKHGSLTSPRTVVAILFALFSLVLTGGMTCSGILAVIARVVWS